LRVIGKEKKGQRGAGQGEQNRKSSRKRKRKKRAMGLDELNLTTEARLAWGNRRKGGWLKPGGKNEEEGNPERKVTFKRGWRRDCLELCVSKG